MQAESSPKVSRRETYKSERTERFSLTQLCCNQQTTVKAKYLHSCCSPRSLSTSNPPSTAFSPLQHWDPVSLASHSLDANCVLTPKAWDLAPPLRPAQVRVRHPSANPASSCWDSSRACIKAGSCTLSTGPLL